MEWSAWKKKKKKEEKKKRRDIKAYLGVLDAQ